MEFTSQICTTKEQSERLLALGLNTETSDMGLIGNIPIVLATTWANSDPMFDTPAWSLNRLIEMMPQEIFYEDSTLILGVFGDGVYYADNEYGEVFRSFDGNLYECIIKCIDWLIKEGFFNKDYLGEE
jgi:hypothetical protein